MKTQPDFEHDYTERMAIMTIDGLQSEDIAHAESTYQVRGDMVIAGLEFGAANIKVMGIRRLNAIKE